MTLMATPAALRRVKALAEYEPSEPETREVLRPLFVADCLFAEVDADERYFDGSLVIGGRMPLEHIKALFSDLRCARRPRVGDMRRMRPNHEGVWKCHATGVRIFGWCAGVNCFVPVTAALEVDLKDKRLDLYNLKQMQVLNFIETNDLGSLVMKGEILEIFPA